MLNDIVRLKQQNRVLKQKLYRKQYYIKNKERLLQYSKDYYKKTHTHTKPKPRWKGKKITRLQVIEGPFKVHFD
jgi:hypothetical protein